MPRNCPTACPRTFRRPAVGSQVASQRADQAGQPSASADKENELDRGQDQLAELSKQIRVLRRQIRESDERLRFRDILGGIGFILGLAGVAFYMKARRRGAAVST